MKELTVFAARLHKIGIQVTFMGNYPWIYLSTINGKRVTEKFQANHGFTVMFIPVSKDQKTSFTDLTEIFSLIRKYSR